MGLTDKHQHGGLSLDKALLKTFPHGLVPFPNKPFPDTPAVPINLKPPVWTGIWDCVT